MKDLQKALEAYAAGEEPQECNIKNGRGRPVKGYELGGVAITKQDMEFIKKAGEIAKKQATEIAINDSLRPMSEGEFAEICKLAVPQLMHRAISLAMISEDPKEVMAVAKEITERGYGKVAKVMDTAAQPTDHVRRGWEDMPKMDGLKVLDYVNVEE